MGFRNIYIQKPTRLSIRRQQLVIQQEEDYTIPVDDLNSIMIDHPQCTITTPALSVLAEAEVADFTCDKKHLPCAIILPVGQYFKKFEALTIQMHVRSKLKDRLWQKVMKQKIANQAKCLALNERPSVELEVMGKQVIEGDRSHQESQAARLYFRLLFNDQFTRRTDDVLNGALNYGYAIIRGAVARDICAYGFEPALGLFHHNELNPFNLADDLMEPFRPFVDLWVSQNIEQLEEVLTSENKQALFALLFTEVLIDGEYHTLNNAIHKVVSSYTMCCRNDSAAGLKLPELVLLRAHEYE